MFYYCFSIREVLVMEVSGLAKLVPTRPGSGWHQSGLAPAGAGSRMQRREQAGSGEPITRVADTGHSV